MPMILALLCCSMAFEKRYLLITTIVLGAIYDAYYIGVIGIYAVAPFNCMVDVCNERRYPCQHLY